ncbi:MAG: hypothetical protein CMK45_04270 [Porticoccus sp.]|nr:hypothetical protein [Porticoccus sp.]
MTARTPWYGEGKQQDRPTPPASLGLASGARRPYGPEASGIKAGWPRFDTKRGAQPASPTAVRRDATACFTDPLQAAISIGIEASHPDTIVESSRGGIGETRSRNPDVERIVHMCDYIEQNLNEDVTLDALRSGVSFQVEYR